MKTKKVLLSLLSTALFSLGLVRLAAAADPLAADAPVRSSLESAPAPDCDMPCSIL
jgi:hypothetical protein